MLTAIFRRWFNLPVTLCAHANSGRNISPLRCGMRSYPIAKQPIRMIGTMYLPPPSRGSKMTPFYARSLSLLAALLSLAVAAPLEAQTVDYDDNDNRLIEVSSLAQLHAIRWDLNGDGSLDAQPIPLAALKKAA